MPMTALAGVALPPGAVVSFAKCPATPECLEPPFEPLDRFLIGSEDECGVVTEVTSETEDETGTRLAREDSALDSDDIMEWGRLLGRGRGAGAGASMSIAVTAVEHKKWLTLAVGREDLEVVSGSIRAIAAAVESKKRSTMGMEDLEVGSIAVAAVESKKRSAVGKEDLEVVSTGI